MDDGQTDGAYAKEGDKRKELPTDKHSGWMTDLSTTYLCIVVAHNCKLQHNAMLNKAREIKIQ